MKRIAIVEDERLIRENYVDLLRNRGYQVEAFDNRYDAIKAFEVRLPDMAIIDIGLGDEYEGGFDLCRALRALSKTIPIMFLTARDNEIDTVLGLQLGADDYLTKDISQGPLMARISTLFRRVDAMQSPIQENKILQRGSLQINQERMQISWKKTTLDFTVTEFWIVHALANRPGVVRSREQLMSDANMTVDNSTITSHLKRIRKKFVATDSEFSSISSVYGAGYRWDLDNNVQIGNE